MKKFRVEYYKGDRSKPSYLSEISKSGKWNGVRISFTGDGKKGWQDKYKNGLINGTDKAWWRNTKNWNFRNWKKNKTQGIQIIFEL